MRHLKKEKIVLVCLLVTTMFLYCFTTVSYAGILLELVFGYACLSYVLAHQCGKHISITGGHVRQGAKNTIFPISLQLHNQGKLPILFGTLPITVTNCLTGETKTFRQNLFCFGKKTVVFRYYLQALYCGCIEVRVSEIEVSDPLRIFVKSRSCPMLEEYYIFPEMCELAMEESQWHRYDMESFHYASGVRGDDSSETFGIRAYQDGDNMKSIHWKLSGKLNTFVVREWSLPVENEVMILLDKGSVDIAVADSLTQLFASLSYTAMLRGVAHMVGWYDNQTKSFCSYSVKEEMEFYQMLASLLKSPHADQEHMAVTHFLESDMDKQFGTYFYVTGSDTAEEETEKLDEYGNVKICRPM